ncbi:Enoyl-CoA hydratase/isomerase, partial [mine drainage metagenome]
APGAAYLAKLLISKGSESSLDDGLTMEAISMGLVYGTEDLKEGITSFLQKREPEFKGR